MAIKHKVQVVVYFSQEVVEAVDKLLAAQKAAGSKMSRSQWIENAAREKAHKALRMAQLLSEGCEHANTESTADPENGHESVWCTDCGHVIFDGYM
jgi:hypothetical protein